MNDTNWFHDLTTDEAKEERATLSQRVIAGLGVICLIVLVAVATSAHAAPMAEASEDGAKITLTDEACKLTAVSNLKHRATWQEKGKTYEGCYGVHPAGLVLAYFADKTVVVLSVQAFTKVSGA